MTVFQGVSGLSADRVVNTFYFSDGEGGAATEQQHDDVVFLMANWWEGIGDNPNQQNYPLAGWLSPWLSRTYQLTTYDMADPITGGLKRPPHPHERTMGAPKAATGIPEEVAVCCTLHGAPPASKRRRGRVYLGPLSLSALEAANNSSMSRPNPLFIGDIGRAATRLATGNVGIEMRWMIRSTVPTENYVPVFAGYVDDAFDTQRRRGPDATTRYPWVIPTG